MDVGVLGGFNTPYEGASSFDAIAKTISSSCTSAQPLSPFPDSTTFGFHAWMLACRVQISREGMLRLRVEHN